jgi:hypothetical protein
MIRIFADSSGREPEVGVGGKTSIFNPARAEFIGLEWRHEALSYLFTIFDQLQSIPGARRGRDRFVFMGHPDLVWVKVDHFSIKA